MNDFVLFLWFIGLYAAAEQFPFARYLKSSIRCYSKLFTVFARFAKCSDNYKQQFILGYAIRLFKNSLILLLLLTILLGAFLLVLTAINQIFPSIHWFAYLISFRAFVVSIIAFIVYYLAKKMYVRLQLFA